MEVSIRPATHSDATPVEALAHRLQEGVAPWRDQAAVAEAVRQWVSESMEKIELDGHAVFVAEVDRIVVGFVSVGEQRHWSGELDAGIGDNREESL